MVDPVQELILNQLTVTFNANCPATVMDPQHQTLVFTKFKSHQSPAPQATPRSQLNHHT